MQSRPLTDSEITSILGHMTSLRDRCLFVLGVKTGFRISELLSLTYDDIIQDRINYTLADSVTVRRRNMKGKRQSRTIPLHPLAKQVLDSYIKSGITGKLFPITRQHAWRIIKTAARKAHLAGCISTHSMRKSFGMNIYNRTNKNIVAAQRALGHASLASTSHYLSVDQDIVDNAILAE